MTSDVSLFIPVYNGAWLIKNCLRKAYASLNAISSNYEIFIVDDTSSDKSYRFSRVLAKAEKIPGKKIRYLHLEGGPSRRENLARSFSFASHEIIGFLDADLACDVSYVNKAVGLLTKDNYDIVIGSRYAKGAVATRSFKRLCFSKLYNILVRFLFKSNILDHQCGLKIFRKSTVLPIIQTMGFDTTYQRGWFWDAELLIRAQRKGLKIFEMPLVWQEAKITTFRFKREIRSLIYMFFLFRKFRNRIF